MEVGEARECPWKVKLSIEKPRDTFCLPGKPRYKQVGLFAFKKVNGGQGQLCCTSRLATINMGRLLNAQWSSSEVRVKISIKRRRGKKQVIFVGLMDFLHHLVTEDFEAESFILHICEGKVLIDIVRSVSEENDKSKDKDKNEAEKSVSDEQNNDDVKNKEDNTENEKSENLV